MAKTETETARIARIDAIKMELAEIERQTDSPNVDRESLHRPADMKDWKPYERSAYYGTFNCTDLRDRVVYHPLVLADEAGVREIVLQMEYGRRPTIIDTIDADGPFAMAERLNARVAQQMSET
jgi:hypothetical protein